MGNDKPSTWPDCLFPAPKRSASTVTAWTVFYLGSGPRNPLEEKVITNKYAAVLSAHTNPGWSISLLSGRGPSRHVIDPQSHFDMHENDSNNARWESHEPLSGHFVWALGSECHWRHGEASLGFGTEVFFQQQRDLVFLLQNFQRKRQKGKRNTGRETLLNEVIISSVLEQRPQLMLIQFPLPSHSNGLSSCLSQFSRRSPELLFYFLFHSPFSPPWEGGGGRGLFLCSSSLHSPHVTPGSSTLPLSRSPLPSPHLTRPNSTFNKLFTSIWTRTQRLSEWIDWLLPGSPLSEERSFAFIRASSFDPVGTMQTREHQRWLVCQNNYEWKQLICMLMAPRYSIWRRRLSCQTLSGHRCRLLIFVRSTCAWTRRLSRIYHRGRLPVCSWTQSKLLFMLMLLVWNPPPPFFLFSYLVNQAMLY